MKPVPPLLLLLVACDGAAAPPSEVRRESPVAHATPSIVETPEPPLAVEASLAPREPEVPRVDLSALCAPIAAATCRVHLGCRAGVSREAIEACIAHIAGACEAERPRLEARVAAGTLRFDRDALRVCEAKIDQLQCAPPDAMQAALGDGCDAVLVGVLGRGEACADAGDCGPGLACTTAAGECPGRCEALGALGGACDAELIPCGAALVCEAGRCVEAAVPMGGTCASSSQCPGDAFCDEDTCVGRRAIGAGCDDDEQCAGDTFCRFLTLGDEVDMEVGSCQPRVGDGAACDPLIGGCAAGLACDEVLGVCVGMPDSAGEPCVADASPCGAGTGLVCQGATGDEALCELEPFVGDACDPGDASHEASGCRFGWCAADPSASGVGECRSFDAAGASCERDDQCGALACVGGRCDRPASRCVATLHDINLGFRYRIR